MRQQVWPSWMVIGFVAWCACSSDLEPEPWDTGALDVRDGLDVGLDSGTPHDAAVRDLGIDVREDAEFDSGQDADMEVGREPIDWSGLGAASRRMCVRDEQTQCVVRDPGEFGGCGEHVGYVFDGTQCVQVLGCTCESPGECRGVFETASACASSCAADGWCAQDKNGFDPLELECTGFRCDRLLYTCVASDEDPSEELTKIMVGHRFVSCRPSTTFDPCQGTPGACGEGRWCCEVAPEPITDDTSSETGMCAVTLMPDVLGFDCISFD